MMRRFSASLTVTMGVLVLGAAAPGCGDDEELPTECNLAAQTGCAEGFVCEEVEGGKPTCFQPVTFQGKVFDALTTKPVAGARVVARDANDAVVTSVAISGADGTYKLWVPTKRDAKGAVLTTGQYTLRADAKAYATFPKAPRVGIPISIADAAGSPPVVKSAATDIALLPLADATGLGTISGKVVAKNPGGTLVVANGATGVADFAGNYVVFNVPAGMTEVRGYAAGINVDPKTANVTADAETKGVDLVDNGKPTATISGSISIVNGGEGTVTSIVLAVEETFEATTTRGEVPKGLRVGNITNNWSIPGVPDGKYVVLAAFENDDFVRDPDTSIGGTEIVHIEVAGADQALSQSFKVTGALDVIAPGAEMVDVVTGTPKFEWEDDSSEDAYNVKLFNGLGDLVWEKEGNFDPGGSANAFVDYDGDPLTPGMLYQFRATSIKDGVPISSTEDLKGVFVYGK
ncbi:MAG: carboxypeptidase-like regulatory domain-containing protein [Polyangiaceae bacterium]|nr:carboxypeptidase-like regulatory domain-containing protein [Polyangiaceae bacterium]